MLETDNPLRSNDQTAFWLWLSGEDTEHIFSFFQNRDFGQSITLKRTDYQQ
jgi:hypothetical protein